MGGVPPVHFKMRFAVPTICREPRFLRRRRAGALDRGQILRQDDAAFEFGGAFIRATGEIDNGTISPESFPASGWPTFSAITSTVSAMRPTAEPLPFPAGMVKACFPLIDGVPSGVMRTSYLSPSSSRRIGRITSFWFDATGSGGPVSRLHGLRSVRKCNAYF